MLSVCSQIKGGSVTIHNYLLGQIIIFVSIIILIVSECLEYYTLSFKINNDYL